LKNLAVITSRWESTRLPGKALKLIGNTEALMHVYKRVAASGVDDVVVATTPSSEPIIDFCTLHNILYYVGDEEDILDRIFNASKSFQASTIVRVWGDQPFIDPRIISKAMRLFNTCKKQYVYTADYPKGMHCAVVGFDDLNNVHHGLRSKKDRHWIHLWMKDNLKSIPCKAPFDWSEYNFGLDTEEDLVELNRLYKMMEGERFGVEDLIDAVTG